MEDWNVWHEQYADPSSGLSRRLAFVRLNIRDYLDSTPGPLTITSACAGDGRDILAVLAERDDTERDDTERITLTLIEINDRLADRAQQFVDEHNIPNVTIKRVDAGTTDSYRDCTPADLLLMCGIMGNISLDDIHNLVVTLPSMCKTDSVVLWTRGHWAPDLTPSIRSWFGENGFAEESFTAPRDNEYSVGRQRFIGTPPELTPGQRIFTFTR